MVLWACGLARSVQGTSRRCQQPGAPAVQLESHPSGCPRTLTTRSPFSRTRNTFCVRKRQRQQHASRMRSSTSMPARPRQAGWPQSCAPARRPVHHTPPPSPRPGTQLPGLRGEPSAMGMAGMPSVPSARQRLHVSVPHVDRVQVLDGDEQLPHEALHLVGCAGQGRGRQNGSKGAHGWDRLSAAHAEGSHTRQGAHDPGRRQGGKAAAAAAALASALPQLPRPPPRCRLASLPRARSPASGAWRAHPTPGPAGGRGPPRPPAPSQCKHPHSG